MRKQGVLTLTGWHLANFVLNSHGTANLRQIHSRKNPLNHPMDKRSRRRRVEDKRDTLQTWALEEGISASSLLGYLLYLENWNLDKALSATAWKIFMGEKVRDLPVVTLEESIWLIEKSRMSQATYLEMRLRTSLSRIVSSRDNPYPQLRIRAQKHEAEVRFDRQLFLKNRPFPMHRDHHSFGLTIVRSSLVIKRARPV